MSKFNLLLAERYGNQSDEASIVGSGLDRLDETDKKRVNQKELDYMVDLYLFNKDKFLKIKGINTKREIIKLAFLNDYESIKSLGVIITKI